MIWIIVLAIAWPLSFFGGVRIARFGDNSGTHFSFYQGRLFLMRQSGPGMGEVLASASVRPGQWAFEPFAMRRRYTETADTLRFDWKSQIMAGRGGAISSRLLLVPAWAVIWVAAVLPTVRLSRWLRVRRLRKRGLCRNCEYDVRATPQRCPECGIEWPLGDQMSSSSSET